ncbi:potassium-transporting ATPase subunit F [Rhodococcus sp. HNM0569]|nr:potassium-transporting ATPase subunit F [Rhodococcus sp. HNM0569]
MTAAGIVSGGLVALAVAVVVYLVVALVDPERFGQ